MSADPFGRWLLAADPGLWPWHYYLPGRVVPLCGAAAPPLGRQPPHPTHTARDYSPDVNAHCPACTRANVARWAGRPPEAAEPAEVA